MSVWFEKSHKWRYRFQCKGIKYYGSTFETKEDAQKAEMEKKIYLGKYKKIIFKRNKDKLKTTAAIGAKSESIVMAAMLSMGLDILIPFGHNHRYDLVVESNRGFIRIQCKTGRKTTTGSIIFNTSSVGTGTKERKNYKEDIDYFAVYCPQTSGVYMVPVISVPDTVGTLRTNSPKSNRPRKLLYAQDYEIGKFFATLGSSHKVDAP